MWANCPAMLGVVEAVGFCNQKLDDIRLLSISTTNYPFRLDAKQYTGGFVGWGPKIIETFMFGQVQNSVAQATCLIRDRFHRVDYNTTPGTYSLDNVAALKPLIADGTNTAQMREHQDAFRKLFLRADSEYPSWP